MLAYLATVYTKHDSFVGHGYLTPNAEENWIAVQSLLENGEPIEALANYPQLVLLEYSEEKALNLNRIRNSYENDGFSVSAAKKDNFTILHCLPPAKRQQLGKPGQN